MGLHVFLCHGCVVWGIGVWDTIEMRKCLLLICWHVRSFLFLLWDLEKPIRVESIMDRGGMADVGIRVYRTAYDDKCL